MRTHTDMTGTTKQNIINFGLSLFRKKILHNIYFCVPQKKESHTVAI